MSRVYSLVFALLLVGCTTKQPPLEYYTIEAPSIKPITFSKYKTKVLKVLYPQSLGIPLGEKMQFSYSAQERGVYQKSQWSTAIMKLLEGVVIETLEESKLFKAVTTYSSTATEDYRLESKVFAFSHRVRGSISEAVVSIDFTLVDASHAKLLKSKRFTYVIPTKSMDAQGYAEATNKAIGRLGQALVVWLKKRIE